TLDAARIWFKSWRFENTVNRRPFASGSVCKCPLPATVLAGQCCPSVRRASATVRDTPPAFKQSNLLLRPNIFVRHHGVVCAPIGMCV
uniref:Uncharacterized protein n=1 Tax=Anopheles minimus TaxID=112268 RepID=A0A182W5U3_9DIPT